MNVCAVPSVRYKAQHMHNVARTGACVRSMHARIAQINACGRIRPHHRQISPCSTRTGDRNVRGDPCCALHNAHALPRRRVPHPHALVVRPGHDARPVRRKRHRMHPRSVARKGRQRADVDDVADWSSTERTVGFTLEPLADTIFMERMPTCKAYFVGTCAILKTDGTLRLCFFTSRLSIFVVGGSVRIFLPFGSNIARVYPWRFCPTSQMFVEDSSQAKRSNIGTLFKCEYARFVERHLCLFRKRNKK